MPPRISNSNFTNATQEPIRLTHLKPPTDSTDEEDDEDEEEDVGEANSRRVIKAFDTYRWAMGPILRFPLEQTETPDGRLKFIYQKGTDAAVEFIGSSVLIAIVTFLVLINTISVILQFPSIRNETMPAENEAAEFRRISRISEMLILQSNAVPLVVIIASLFHATVGSWQIFHQRNFIASYLNSWTEAVKSSKIDAACGTKRYMKSILNSYYVFMFVFTALALMGVAPVTSDAPGVLGILVFRLFFPSVHISGLFLRCVSGYLFIYILISSKAFIFLFLLVSKMLRNSFRDWNHRLQLAFQQNEFTKKREEKLEQRTGFDCLSQDHLTLVRLVEGARKIFSNLVVTFYISQSISIAFELYYCTASVFAPTYGEFWGVGRLNGTFVFLHLIQDCIFLYVVCIAGTEVGNEVARGLEILRTNGIAGKTSDEILQIMKSKQTKSTRLWGRSRRS